MWCRLKYHLFSVKFVMMENPYNNSFQDVIKFAMVDRNIPEMSSLCIESTIYVKKLSFYNRFLAMGIIKQLTQA